MRIGLLAKLVSGTLVILLAGCTAAGHSGQLHSARERQFTLGLVQAEIRKGMGQAEVIEALGSPNIVTRSEEGQETYVYDKIATEASYSNDSGSVSGGVGAGGAPGSTVLILGGIGGSYGRSAGAAAQTERTLTVIIKFDDAGRVADFSYRSSRF